MGLQCCPLPTAVFSNHTGYDSFYYTDFTAHMDAYMEQWEMLGLHFDGILTGFLGSPEQIGFVCRFMERFKAADTITVIDPVMGDDGALYATYSSELAENMTRLLRYADILTPNLTEACILTGTPYRHDMEVEELLGICEALYRMGPEKIVISGLKRGRTWRILFTKPGKTLWWFGNIKPASAEPVRGDVFASILIADAVRGASAFIAKALRRIMELKLPEPDGIAFEEFFMGVWRKSMKKESVKYLALSGLLGALILLFMAWLHIPVGEGYVHIGDAFVYLGEVLLPTPYGILTAVGGAVLADCLSGYALWAPASFLIKGLSVLLFTSKGEKLLCLRNILAHVGAGILCAGGYYLKLFSTGIMSRPFCLSPATSSKASAVP